MQRAQLPPIARFGRSNPRAVSQRHPHVCRPRLARRARRRWLARSCARCCAATSSRPLHTLPQSCSRTCILRRCAVLCARALGHEHGTIMRRRANWTKLFFSVCVGIKFRHSKELDAFSGQVRDPGRGLARWCQQRRFSICRSAGRDADDLPADWPRVTRQRQRLAANFCNSTLHVCAPRTPRADDAPVQATTSCCRLQAAPVPVCPLWG